MASNLPPKGMRDFLPKDKALREYVMKVIREEYARNGFTEIETSQIENLSNLENSDGGDNTKLIFKILKRGDKLKLNQIPESESALTDLGLRFDLTLPLSRFYANNRNELPPIFKAIQIGNVFRAERPQKGRYRNFIQCDVDVIGDATNLTEIELINTVGSALTKLGLNELTIKINDRRILKGLTAAAGFAPEEFQDVAITLDKLDKIGQDGILEELSEKGYGEDKITSLMQLSDKLATEGLTAAKELSAEGFENINEIIEVIESVAANYKIVFDYSLVRGMGYYTSTIFEVFYGSLGYAVGGGGRYDEMIGKLSGIDVPACGFSIGYERIIDILREEKRDIPTGTRLALFYDTRDSLKDVIKTSIELRETYSVVSVFAKKKKFGKQIERLAEQGFDAFTVYAEELEIKDL
ncbi:MULTISPECIES: histidine--tRNA ligase [unclassified Fusibacter]|uniref:histidine--tRNA ligase n=1 Tax=unclassified Fusibacter TaxID=2624464 RepID=UPI0010124F0A|nr:MULTISPECIES: histidine--tRNA ligase [unclassified Fusibacter]MCK8061193.1 histidine--tRNA ligase [Fusibacter sp. A2]NPE23270.1 histidine--tRNA ligase [Fusibacter sp. A1]RXV59314.1 histidine--tRNA ligase [Fusibacter sp. A1]